MAKRKQADPTLTESDGRELLQTVGLRRTASRVAVLCELASAGSPLTHAEVAERLATTGFGLPTIFRCLCDLTEAGLAVRIDLGDHVWRFGYHNRHARDADHPHFLCVDCGTASCLPGIDVRISAGKQGELGEVTEVLLKGHCPNCR